MSVASLHTDRLVLRAPVDADSESFVAMCADPHVMRFIADGRALTRPDAELRFWALQQRFETDGFGLFTVTDRDGAYLGFCGTAEVAAGRIPDRPTEIGWRLVSGAWGQGYATEAAGAVVSHMTTTTDLEALVALVREPNTASRRVCDKLGMALLGERQDECRRPFLLYHRALQRARLGT